MTWLKAWKIVVIAIQGVKEGFHSDKLLVLNITYVGLIDSTISNP